MKYNDIEYSFKTTFKSQISVIVTYIDEKEAHSSDKNDVRRLSTLSYAGRRISADNFLTQWRWYWKNDS